LRRELIIPFLFFSITISSICLANETRRDFYSFKATLVDGQDISFSDFKGKVVLVANVALKCGTSSQFNDLQELYSQNNENLVILGVASNDFTRAEPENESFGRICKTSYGVQFPILQLAKVRGINKSGLYSFLTESGPDETRGEVEFNFEKFVIDKKGIVRKRFGSFTGVLSGKFEKELRRLLDE